MRGQHSPTCATGARAELRGPCNCGAGELPYRARTLKESDAHGRRLIEIQVDGPLTTSETAMLSIVLQELTRQEGERWAKAQEKRKKDGDRE